MTLELIGSIYFLFLLSGMGLVLIVLSWGLK